MHHLAAPEREQQVKLVRAMAGHQPLHLAGLVGIQQLLGSMTAATLLGPDGSSTGDPPALEPAIDRVLVQAEG